MEYSSPDQHLVGWETDMFFKKRTNKEWLANVRERLLLKDANNKQISFSVDHSNSLSIHTGMSQ